MAEEKQLRTQVICYIDDASPIAYRNLYDDGDEWEKVRGCEDCPLEIRLRCCGNHNYTRHISCAMQDLRTGECGWQKKPNEGKPWYCMIRPFPNATQNFAKQPCVLEYKCVKGPKEGKIRRVCDPNNVFVEVR